MQRFARSPWGASIWAQKQFRLGLTNRLARVSASIAANFGSRFLLFKGIMGGGAGGTQGTLHLLVVLVSVMVKTLST